MVRPIILALMLVSSAATADEATRAAVFDVDRAVKACGDDRPMVAQSYCLDNVEKQARAAVVFYLRKADRHYGQAQALPDDYGLQQGAEARKAINEIKATARAYDVLIAADCTLAARAFHGGSGSGLASQACRIAHLGRQLGRLRAVLPN